MPKHGNQAKADLANVGKHEHVETAWRLRRSGLSQRQIAREMKAGLGSVNKWLNAYKLEAANRASDAALEGRLQGVDLCDDMIRGLVASGATRGNEKKAAVLLHVLERKAAYLGCDAPKELRQKLTVDSVSPITLTVADVAELIKTAKDNEASASNGHSSGANGVQVREVSS